MRRLIAFAAIAVVGLLAEEATQGWMLGRGPLAPLCRAIGGKAAVGRCYTRLCYWFGDCGNWTHPSRYIPQLSPGDPVSKVVFWLGEPDTRESERLSWWCGKPSSNSFHATIREGRLVAIAPCKAD
jgi:hypothetical protein